MPSCGSLVPASSQRPAQSECQAGAGYQPSGVVPGEAGEPGGLGDGQLDGGDTGRQGWPPRAGTGASPRGIRRSASLISSSLSVVPRSWSPAGGDGESDAAGKRAADGGGPELGGG